MGGLQKISFWTSSFEHPSHEACQAKNCIGYAILKRDCIPSIGFDRWHVFEAVFRKYAHRHNCVPAPIVHEVMLSGLSIGIPGILYAQQNELNKACAQVALRSLLSRLIGRDIAYDEINSVAQNSVAAQFVPGKGLDAQQIQAVLKHFDVAYRDYEYTQHKKEYRTLHPYQKFVYAGVESGAGALVGFHLAGRAVVSPRRHIIPFYGHTFNKDTWAPEADLAYFHVGEGFGFIPSENWTSSFLGHDDNFGPNFCVPRLYIPADDVDYVVELLRPGIRYSGASAEACALQFLDSVLGHVPSNLMNNNVWLSRLAHAHLDVHEIVLRAVAMGRHTYIDHLRAIRDWDRHRESKRIIDILEGLLPSTLWVVEVSIPQLFPGNERKLGEIVLDGSTKLTPSLHSRRRHFVLARLPEAYYFARSPASHEEFLVVRSRLSSHVPVVSL